MACPPTPQKYEPPEYDPVRNVAEPKRPPRLDPEVRRRRSFIFRWWDNVTHSGEDGQR